MKKVLIILGHPNKESFCGALAESYKQGAVEAGAEVRTIALADLDFALNLKLGYKEIQELEPDLKAAQEAISWSEHIVWVYPIWWATMPALLKGFLDRTFLPGFAFKYRKDSPFWDRLLTGRSARMIVTMDAPVWYNYWINGNAGPKAMKKATLEFSGFKPVKVTAIGSVKSLKSEQLDAWVNKIKNLGREIK